jgi:plastocyanin
MKRSTSSGSVVGRLLVIWVIAVIGPAPLADGRPGTLSDGGITIIDQTGQQVASTAPRVTGQIFDVTVSPNGLLQFAPSTVNIAAGDTVRWTWASSGHSVTSGNPCIPNSQFCSPNDMNCSPGVLSNAGAVYMHTFAQAGTYTYFCVLHCEYGMIGTVNVSAPLQVTSAVSRKSHPAPPATFDVDLPLTGTPGVECRTGGPTSDYTMIITFSGTVTVNGSPQAEVTSGMATIGSGGVANGGMVTVNGNLVTVPLTNFANAQTIVVRLNGVNSGSASDWPSTDVTISMSLLIGDANGNGIVNAADVALCKSRLGQSVNATNFRSDVNANGAINSGDVAITKANLGTGLP